MGSYFSSVLRGEEDGGGGTNPQSACAGITCNGTNRTKKSASEINAIPPTTGSDEYPDTTFRSPCCKWNNLPDPVQGKRSGINYTDFLNTTEACPLDRSNRESALYVNAGDNVPRDCGAFEINVNVGPDTPASLLNADGKFQINFIHDHPSSSSDTCPMTCVCPRETNGEYWNWRAWGSDGHGWGNSSGTGFISCQKNLESNTVT